MLDWTAVLTATIPVVSIAAIIAIVWLISRKVITRVKWRGNSIDFGEPGQGHAVGTSYLIEIIFEVVSYMHYKDRLAQKQRRIVKEHIRQWRSNVSIYVREELEQVGIGVEGLYRNPIYRYFSSIIAIMGYQLTAIIMEHAEQNGFESLENDKARDQYVKQKSSELQARARELFENQYVVSEASLITQDQAMQWLAARKPLVDMIWEDMYRQMIDASLQLKSELLMYIERITSKGAQAGLSESDIDHIRNRLRKDLLGDA